MCARFVPIPRLRKTHLKMKEMQKDPRLTRSTGLGGRKGVMKMTNFAPMEFRSIWNAVNEPVSANWNVVQAADRLIRERMCCLCR